MCGIAGFVGEGDRGDLERMTRRLAHRGPDAEGFYSETSAGVHLGHRRLSIIDLAGGAQPMVEANGALRHRLQRRDLQSSGAAREPGGAWLPISE